jgi:FkbM family methyltransferase
MEPGFLLMQQIQGLFFKDFQNAYFPEILKEIYRDRIYEPFLKGKSDLVIGDLGANVGLTTHYFYPFAKKIYSVEPSREHFEVLEKMLEFNHMFDKVEPIKKATSMRNGTTTFYHNPNSTMFSLKQEVADLNMENEEVETITMDTFFTQNNIEKMDFLKLDIEGSECEVIMGEEFEKVADRIGSLVVEYHQWSGINPNLLITALKDYGFKVETIPSEAILIGATKNG